MTIYLKPKNSNQVLPVQILSKKNTEIQVDINNILTEYLGKDFADFVDGFINGLFDDCNYYKAIAEGYDMYDE